MSDLSRAAGEDGIPMLLPVSRGREGPEPMVINLPTLHEEAAKVEAEARLLYVAATRATQRLLIATTKPA